MNGEDSKQEWRRISSAFMCAEYFACMLFYGNVWKKWEYGIVCARKNTTSRQMPNGAKANDCECLILLHAIGGFLPFLLHSLPHIVLHTKRGRVKKERISHDVSFKSNQIGIAGCFTLLCIAIYCYLSLFM